MGTIDDKYDVAISTACGQLDHVVVDNMETAIKCVEFLKSTKLGSASFIGLDKVQHNVNNNNNNNKLVIIIIIICVCVYVT